MNKFVSSSMLQNTSDRYSVRTDSIRDQLKKEKSSTNDLIN